MIPSRKAAYLAFPLAFAALLSLPPRTGRADQTGGLPALEQRVAALEQQAQTQIQTISLLQAQIADLQAGLAQERTARAAADGALQAKTQFISVSGTDMVITGANLQLVNGAGSTATSNGLGNLILGYNEPADNGNQARTGSHYLVVGPGHSYSSYGGIVAGTNNRSSGAFASALGGYGNIASGWAASVTGGLWNLASGDIASVSGGFVCRATGEYASVTGGYGGLAEGWSSTVSGGQGGRASGGVSSVTGGIFNWARGDQSSITGGQGNTTNGPVSSISGGWGRATTDWGTWRAGTLFSSP